MTAVFSRSPRAHGVEQPPDPIIALAHLGLVEAAHVRQLGFGISAGGPVVRPRDFRSVRVPRIRLKVTLRCVPGFVRIEGIDPQEEAFRRVFEPADGFAEQRLGRVRPALAIPVRVPPIPFQSPDPWLQLLDRAGQLDHRRVLRLEDVVGLPRDVFDHVESAPKSGAFFHEVRVVGEERRDEPVSLEHFAQHGEVHGQRSPINQGKRVTAGEDLDSVHHGRKGTEVELRKAGAFRGQTIQVGRQHRLPLEEPQMVVAERVGADDHNVHLRAC